MRGLFTLILPFISVYAGDQIEFGVKFENPQPEVYGWKTSSMAELQKQALLEVRLGSNCFLLKRPFGFAKRQCSFTGIGKHGGHLVTFWKLVEQEAERVRNILASTYATSTDINVTKLTQMWSNTYPFTAKHTWNIFPEDDTTYVTTGDIEQMWLRDSSVQMMTYLPLMANQKSDSALRQVFESVMKRHTRFLKTDPYASAFYVKHGNNPGEGPNVQRCKPGPNCPNCQCTACSPACGDYTYQHDFELDSLMFPLWLHYKYWKMTGATTHLDKEFFDLWEQQIIPLLHTEQWHMSQSPYYYQPLNNPVKDGVGLVWSFARPSDDQTEYGYNIPQNMLVVVCLGQFAEIAQAFGHDTLAKDARQLALDVDTAINTHAVFRHPVTKKDIYAFEVDGYGNKTLQDDANMPNLLWAPYMGYTKQFRQKLHDNSLWGIPVRVGFTMQDFPDYYPATREFILSDNNMNYFTGKYTGLGSQHHSFGLRWVTPGPQCTGECIWHLGLIMSGWTASTNAERTHYLQMLLNTDNDQHLLHEGFDPYDVSQYNRDWFGWADGLFCLWVLHAWMPSSTTNVIVPDWALAQERVEEVAVTQPVSRWLEGILV